VFKLDPREQVEGLIENGSLTVEKDGFFETPESVVKRMLELVPLPENGELILEPSAGLGAIAKHLRGNITLIEKNPQRCEELRKQFKNVLCLDFLVFDPPGNENCYGRIYMNPPFEAEQDIDHICHAYGWLAEGGSMVSVMSEGPFFRNDRKASEFRSWLEDVKGQTEKLPNDAFRISGTSVQTRLICIKKY